MVEPRKKHRFMDKVKNGLSYISQTIAASVFPQITKGAEIVMNNIDDRIIRIEKRILKKIISLLIIGLGGVFLIFALFFFLIENLGWSNAAAFFYMGITIFIIGLLLKAGESDIR